MKLYTKKIHSCTQCPNVMLVDPISPKCKPERRCKAVIYRHSVYRLIHGDDEGYFPEWCVLEDEVLDPPF